jgi:hypothetical protein
MFSNHFPHYVVSLHVFVYPGQLESIFDVALQCSMNSDHFQCLMRVSVYMYTSLHVFARPPSLTNVLDVSTKFDERP